MVAAIVLVVAVLGVAIHVIANVQAGPLDQQFEMTWASLSVIEQWWLALTGGVGPAPTLAPAALAEIALATILATVAHPVFRMPSEASAI